VAAMEFAVRINTKEGALEVIGPDKEWVDAKLEQLSPVFSGYQRQIDEDEGAAKPRTSTGKAARKKPAQAVSTSAEAPEDGAATAKRRRGAGGRSEINPELREQLTTEVKQKLRGYIDARRGQWDGSQSAQAAIIATFLHDELGMRGVDQHDLYTVYSAMGERVPRNIRSQLTNARQRARYFEGISGGKMVLSHAGENFVRFDSLNGAGGRES
jgi:hypothetical protein